jgi:hypothetical protein
MIRGDDQSSFTLKGRLVWAWLSGFMCAMIVLYVIRFMSSS